MTRYRRSFSSEVASEFLKVNRANAQFASLVREFEYPAVWERIRSPPVPLYLVLLGLLQALYVLAVRLPLHALLELYAQPLIMAWQKDARLRDALAAAFANAHVHSPVIDSLRDLQDRFVRHAHAVLCKLTREYSRCPIEPARP